MVDPRVEGLARLLVEYSTAVQPEERVLIASSVAGMPLLREVYRETIRAGALPYATFEEEDLVEILLTEGNDEQLRYIHQPLRIAIEEYDVRIAIRAPTNTRYLSGVDLERQVVFEQGRRELMATMMRRTAEGEFRWCGTQFPTSAAAQDADMSLSDYEDFVYDAYHVESEDPVAVWQEKSRSQQRLVDWLEGKAQVTVKGEHIDLRLSIAGRTFINDDGHFNMPGGEIFTGPVEESVNGWVRFSYPAVRGGREVTGVELYFEEGRVVKATAEKNEGYLHSVLNTDEGARYLGEWAIGTNRGIDQFTRNILFDEKIGGTLHMAIGAGYPETGSQNKSAVHWDMICDLRDGAEIHVDGTLFYKGGEFLVE
ncbi:MAG: aminopeptidase [Chloroflexota bacterium]|nr:aminopeptidase [Chloroflexota bacterium]